MTEGDVGWNINREKGTVEYRVKQLEDKVAAMQKDIRRGTYRLGFLSGKVAAWAVFLMLLVNICLTAWTVSASRPKATDDTSVQKILQEIRNLHEQDRAERAKEGIPR